MADDVELPPPVLLQKLDTLEQKLEQIGDTCGAEARRFVERRRGGARSCLSGSPLGVPRTSSQS
jgi:hypothetical protein